MRFVAEDTVVAVVEDDPRDENRAPLADNLARLRSMRLADGRPLSVVDLPMPAPVYHDGRRLPASYANFYIGNEVVLLPVFNDPRDATARRILARCFPGTPGGRYRLHRSGVGARRLPLPDPAAPPGPDEKTRLV